MIFFHQVALLFLLIHQMTPWLAPQQNVANGVRWRPAYCSELETYTFFTIFMVAMYLKLSKSETLESFLCSATANELAGSGNRACDSCLCRHLYIDMVKPQIKQTTVLFLFH